jgi:hypothetical protein
MESCDVAGSDVCIIFQTSCSVELRSIDNHQCTNIDIGAVGGAIQTHKGSIIGTMQKYTLLNKGPPIHFPCQFEWHKNDINDKSVNVPEGLQHIKTLDGYIIPLRIKDGFSLIPASTMLKKAFKSPNPALNIYCHQEAVVCDIVNSDIPAIYDGSTADVIFVGATAQVSIKRNMTASS